MENEHRWRRLGHWVESRLTLWPPVIARCGWRIGVKQSRRTRFAAKLRATETDQVVRIM